MQACAGSEDAGRLVDKFLDLAATLEHAKAIVLPAKRNERDDEDNVLIEDAHPETGQNYGGHLPAYQPRSLCEADLQAELLHPMNIALLAFRMGGPINAANTAYFHRWKLPYQAVHEAQMHMEGDNDDIFDDHRMTLVWEGNMRSPSGSHHLFLSGDIIPRKLETAIVDEGGIGDVPVAIIYDSRNAALVYDCQNPEAVRHSISLDFHLNTMTNDMLQILQRPKNDELRLSQLTLGDLVTSFAIPDYNSHFHSLLFSRESLGLIIDRLGSIDVREPKVFRAPARMSFDQRVKAYKHENHSKIPPAILSTEKDIPISGKYSSTAIFFNQVCFKARRDVHLPLGWDLFPNDTADDGREWARKHLRDSTGERVSQRLAQYSSALIKTPHTIHDLLSTMQLQSLANSIHKRCLELARDGYIDSLSILTSVPSLAFALGAAVNGSKEVDITEEPWVDEADCQIFRTRCWYLFLCADWLVDYLGKPTRGPFMLSTLDEKQIGNARGEVTIIARMLLRNWLAWALFVEGLPEGGFWVRQTASGF
jgi:hypothetical protein